MEREEVLTLLQEEIKEATKRIYEKLMEEERRLYLEEHATRGNGYYTRSLLTPVGEIEDLRVPRTRDGDFSPAILPYRRRASFELGEVVMHMFASGSSVRDVSNFLYSIYSAYYSPASISRLINVAEEEIRCFLYTTNAIERLNKEVRRRAKVIEIFSPISLEKVLYLVLREENAKLRRRRLRDFQSFCEGN